MRTTTHSNFTRAFGLLSILALIGTQVSAQLVVSPQSNLQQLAAAITGPGVQISNPVITCHAQGFGEFNYTGNILGITSGVLLTSGTINNAVGPNNVENKTFQAGTPGNTILNTVTGRTTYDACRFEFDIIPSGDSLNFNFVFGSEEYNEWVGSQFNDVFGFFISGPGIVGDPGIGSDRNIALIPSTTQAVTINNVNNGSNQLYYFDNAGGPFIQYDGMTRGLKAGAAVQACQSYHLKLIVADASDRKFDSGVFIERINSNLITMSSRTQNGSPDMVEGCNPGWVRFTRSSPRPTPLTLQYYLQGTATNGVDYTAIGNVNPAIPKTVTIPANATFAEVAVYPIADGLNEGTEFLRFILGNPFCPSGQLDTLIFNIVDTLIAEVSPIGTSTICLGNSLQFQVNGGANYTWSPATGLSATNIANPVASPTQNTNYTVTITDGTCSRTVSRFVRVSNPVLSGVVTQPLCSGQSNGAINLSVSGGYAPFNFAWTGPNGFTATTEDLVNIGPGTYTVTVNGAFNCVRTQSFNLGSPAALSTSLMPSIQAFGQNIACFGASTGTLTSTISGGTAPYSSSWNGPNGFTSNAQSLTNIAAGSYTVTITDINGCTATNSYTMTQSSALVPATSNIQPVLCFGSNTGAAEAIVSGGMPPYSFSWNSSPVQTGANATSLPAGTRTVTVTDGYGCTAIATAIIPGPSQALTNTIGSQTNVNCFGNATGSATINVSGGTAPYSFSWNTSPAQTAATATNLVAGNYTCTITDANGCSSSRNVSISQPAVALSSNISSQTNVNCFGASTGSATLNVSGGSTPYMYSWNSTPVQTGATAVNLGVGPYTCMVTDANGCTTSRNITILQPAAALNSSISGQTNISCFGGNGGNASVSANGGTMPYAYSWNTSPAQTSATATNLTAGTFICTITDANGCTTTRSVAIAQPSAVLSSSISAQTNAGCFGASTGSATVNAAGGTAPYSFLWNTSPTQNTASASALSAGSYTCTITDANGCIATRNVLITQPSAGLSSSVSAQTNVNCFGNNTGGATVSATGGTGPYGFIWNTAPVQSTATASGLIAGNYTCTITDASGCSAIRTVVITQPSAALSGSVSGQTNVGCFGLSTGSATVNATGGTGPYGFSWNSSPVQSSATATGLAAGSYTCTITDINGCIATRTVTITQPAVTLSGNISAQTNVNCFGTNSGAATAQGSGGTAPYTYLWNTTPAQNTATAAGLAAGNYTCTITDANGCNTTRNANITQPAQALSSSIGALTNVACFGGATGSATVSVAGGTAPYSYSWNTTPLQSTANATGLSAGTYTCTITDVNGCSTTRNAVIAQPNAALGSTIGSQTQVNCFGTATGNATVIATGGTAPYAYSWNTAPVQSTATANNLAAGTYACTITDVNSCGTTRSITITQPAAALSTSIAAQTNVNCRGNSTGSASINAVGGTAPYTYSWNSSPVQNASMASNLAAGAYICIVTDAVGCSTTRSVSITQPIAVLALNGTVSSATCGGSADGSVNASVTGGTSPYSFSWAGPGGFTSNAEDIAGIGAGVYTLSMIDALGCTAVRSFNVGQPGQFSITGTISDHNGFGASCSNSSDGSIDQTVSGGTAPYTHAWSGPGGFSSSTEDVSGLITGNYTYVITDDNGCSTSASYSITAPASLSAAINAATVPYGWNIACNGASTGSIATAISGGLAPFSTSWTGPSGYTSNATDINNLSAGTYTITITDANACSAVASTTLSQAPALAGNGGTNANVSCNGGANGVAFMSASGGTAPYTYSWNTVPVQTDAVASLLTAGTWNCSITDANGCSATATATISEPSASLSVSITGFTDVLCFDAAQGTAEAVAAGGTGPYSYSWNTAPSQNGPSASGLPQGPWIVTATDANGCQANATATIGGPQSGIDGFFEDVSHVTCFGLTDGWATINASGGSNSLSIVWNTQPPTNGPTATGLAPGMYMVHVSDNNGCDHDKFFPLEIRGPASPFTLTLDVTNISCPYAANGAIDLTFIGGQGPYTHQWYDTQGNQTGIEDPTGLDPDIYSLHAFDALGCVIDTSITFIDPMPVTITGTVDPAECNGSNTGAIDATIVGGTQPYNVVWIGPAGFTAVSEDLSTLEAGIYVITASDQNGCSSSLSFNVSQPGSLQATLQTGTHPGSWGTSCNGASDGSIALDVTGGSAPYSFSWSGTSGFTSTDEDLSGLQAGTYNVTISDQNSCSVTLGATITSPEPVSGSLVVSVNGNSNIGCAGGSDGSIDLTVSGGTTPFGYSWSSSNGYTSSSEDISNLAAGTYNVLITDANGCTFGTSTMLQEPAVLTSTLAAANYVGGSQTSCSGATDGSVDLTVSGGTMPYQFAWTDGTGYSANTEDVGGLSAGVYQVTITDANGCSITNMVTLNAPPVLDLVAVLSTTNGNNVSCQGANDGSIDLSPSGGSAPYNYVWSNGSTNQDLSGIGAGAYSVQVTDANGCTANAGYTLTAPAMISVDLALSTNPGGPNVSCFGATDGSIAATVQGGTAPFNIQWNGPNGFSSSATNIAGLEAGSYMLEVIDANGCSFGSTSVLTQPAIMIVDLTSTTFNGGYNVPCANMTTGNAMATVTGGSPNYTYAWSGPNGFTGNAQNLSNLGAGTYSVQATDINGCTASASFAVQEPVSLDAQLTIQDLGGGYSVSCIGNDGSVTTAVNGGIPQYLYSWTGPNGFGSTSSDISGLEAGTYHLIIADANGCTYSDSITLEAPEAIDASFATNSSSCNGAGQGAIDLTVVGGIAPFEFAWSGPNNFVNSSEDPADLDGGTYSVMITDALGCVASFNTTLGEPAAISSGTYVSFYGLFNLQCVGDSTGVIELTPTGGTAPYSMQVGGPAGYNSTNASNTGLIAGDYNVTIVDANGCTMDTVVTLNEPTNAPSTSLTVSLYPSGTNVSCHGATDGWIDATITGGNGPYEFSWRGPDSLEFSSTEDVFNLPAGVYGYELVVTDANQCSFLTQVVLTEPDSAIMASAALSQFNGGFNVSCNGTSDGSIALAANGGNGGFNYSWTGPNGFSATTPDLSGIGAGVYDLVITDINGCMLNLPVEVVAPQAVQASLAAFAYPGGTNISCSGASDGSIDATMSGGAMGYSVVWSGPNGFTSTTANIAGLLQGTYCINITDANGCTGQSCVTLAAPAPLTTTINSTPAACGQQNGSVDLEVFGGSQPFQYAWSNGSSQQDISGSAAGAFAVIITDANGCSANANATVQGTSGIVAQALVSNSHCADVNDGSIDLSVGSGVAPFSYQWNNGATSEDLTQLSAGAYSVIVTDANGCTWSSQWTLTSNPAIEVLVSVQTHINGFNVSSYQGHDGSASIVAFNGTAPFTYIWSNGSTADHISGVSSGTFVVTVTDATGCSTTRTIVLTEPSDLVLPTGYTPNGDGYNDVFYIQGLEAYPHNTFTVFNRWGNVVYDRLNYKNDWAGENSQGDALPNGTYFVILNVNDGQRTLQTYVDLRR